MRNVSPQAGDGHRRPPKDGHPWQGHQPGWGDTYGSTTGTSGTSRTGGTSFTLEKGRKTNKKKCQDCGEEVAVGTRTHLSPVQHPVGGQPYLVTRSTSGAGGADGASQTSETVFARSAVSTFGTGVALGEEDDGGLPGEVPSRVVTPAFPLRLCTAAPKNPWFFILAGIILLLPGSGGRAGLSPQQGTVPKGRAQMGTEVALSIPSPGGCCPPALA